MPRRFFYALGGVLPHRLSIQVRELYWACLLQNLALAMLMLFEPIYLWQQGLGLRGVILFFLGVYVAYFWLMPLGANFATRFGFQHSMVWSTLAQVLYYTALFLIAQSYVWIVPAVLLYAVQKALYWPAYHADFARYSDTTEEAKEISGLSVALSFVYVIGPLLAGLLLAVGSWPWLFMVGGVLLLLSNWPLLRRAEVFTPRTFPYLDTYRRLLAPAERRHLFGYMGFGEELIVLVLWPIFISIIVPAYADIGAVVAGSTLLMALLTLYAGKLSDEGGNFKVLRWSTGLYALDWVARVAAVTPFLVFVTDAWSRVAKNILSVPLTAITYERAQTRSVMDSVVFFEMSLVVGKMTAAVILLIVFSFTSAWWVAWLVASAMTLLYLLI